MGCQSGGHVDGGKRVIRAGVERSTGPASLTRHHVALDSFARERDAGPKLRVTLGYSVVATRISARATRSDRNSLHRRAAANGVGRRASACRPWMSTRRCNQSRPRSKTWSDLQHRARARNIFGSTACLQSNTNPRHSHAARPTSTRARARETDPPAPRYASSACAEGLPYISSTFLSVVAA